MSPNTNAGSLTAMWGLAVLLVSAFEAFPENTSPAPPQITNSITFDGSENHFVIPGNAGDANGYTVDRTFHAVLVSNLGVSFDVGAMAGNESTGQEGRDGPMISYECDEFPIKVPLSPNSRERYFQTAGPVHPDRRFACPGRGAADSA